MSNADRLHDRYLTEPRFHAVTERLRSVIHEVQVRERNGRGGIGDFLGRDELLAFAEAIDVLYRPAALPADPAAALAALHGHPGQTCTGFDHSHVLAPLVEDAALRGLTAEPLTTGHFARVHGRDVRVGEPQIVEGKIRVRLTRTGPDLTEPDEEHR